MGSSTPKGARVQRERRSGSSVGAIRANISRVSKKAEPLRGTLQNKNSVPASSEGFKDAVFASLNIDSTKRPP